MITMRLSRAAAASIKRATDVAIAAAALLALAPLMAAIALVIRLDDGGPALYRQRRVGRGGALFEIIKFRSMGVDNGGPDLTVANDCRITRPGRWLRHYKLDELPQLWNVLVGEMSLVGPRPETPALFAAYSPAQRRALVALRPGVTDWASLLLRDESELLASAADPADYYRRVLLPIKHQLWRCYRRERGLISDGRILAATLWAVAAPGARNPWLSPGARACLAGLARTRA